MISLKLQNKVLNISQELIGVPDARNIHFSFLMMKNRIISVGWNEYHKTHPQAKRNGYRFDSIHSELSAIYRCKDRNISFKDCFLVNVRLNRFGEIRISMPCILCQKWLRSIGIREVWFTNTVSCFQEMLLF
jgi:deoxycytidylate deaminase